jgi:hypothetical protein
MNHQFTTLLVLAAMLPGIALAQSDTEAEAIPQYDVELVVFKNIQAPKGREFILPVSSPSRDDKILDLSSSSSVTAAAKLGYRILPSDEFRLLESVNRIIESPRYELLLHVAWRQPGLDREKALPVWLKGGRIYGSEYTSIDNQIEMIQNLPRAGSDDPTTGKDYTFDEQTLEAIELQRSERQNARANQGLYEFEGKITIALARYLHAYTDLVFRRPRLSVDTVENNPAQEEYLAAYAADTRILNNHRLREHRRMRSKNLHYLDNPEFGLLILITPYEAPAETAAPATAE